MASECFKKTGCKAENEIANGREMLLVLVAMLQYTGQVCKRLGSTFPHCSNCDTSMDLMDAAKRRFVRQAQTRGGSFAQSKAR